MESTSENQNGSARVIFIILFLSFLILSVIVWYGLTDQIDSDATRYIYENFGKDNYMISRSISYLGGYYGLVPGIILVFAYFLYKDNMEKGILFGGMMLSSAVMFIAVKYIVNRPRPEYAMLSLADSSYPSGHATGSFVFYIGLYFFLFYKDEKSIDWLKLLSLLILPIMIGLSRLLLALHYPTDIIGGYLLGGSVLALFFTIVYGNKQDKTMS